MSDVWFAVLMERSLEQHAATAVFDLCMRAQFRGYRRLQLPYARTDLARNKLVSAFLSQSKDDMDALVMLDSDHTHPYDIVERLVAHETRNGERVGVVGALAFRRGEPFDPCCFIRAPSGNLVQPLDWQPGLAKMTVAGTGAILIRRWVFEELEAKGYHWPHFRYQYIDDPMHEQGFPTEDMYFGLICEAAGIPHYVDMSLVTPHLITSSIDETSFRQFVAEHPERFGPQAPMVQSKRPKVSVILPSKGRPDKLRACVERLFETTRGHDVECIIVTADPVPTQLVERDGVRVIVQDCTAIEGWNLGASVANGDWLVLGADDLWWGDGWLDAALRTPNAGYVGFNDLHTDGEGFSTHYMVTREFAQDVFGGVLVCPHYRSWYVDVEAAERARRVGAYVWARDAKVEHRHHLWGLAEKDDTYARLEPLHAEDHARFDARCAAGFPNDYPPAIGDVPTITGALVSEVVNGE